jgi:hypothetical protein
MLGPHAFAREWLKAAVRNDIGTVWPQMTDEFRLTAVQDWIWHNPQALDHPLSVNLDRDELARVLALPHPDNQLFQHVARVVMRGIREATGDVDMDELGSGSRPRPIGPDTEVVRFFHLADLDRDEDGEYVWPSGASARTISVIVQHTSTGWAVAGMNDHLRRPGWPPTFEQVAGPDD